MGKGSIGMPAQTVDVGSAGPGVATEPVAGLGSVDSSAPGRLGTRRASHSIGPFPQICIVAGVGLVLMSIADALSRSGRGGGQALFWISLLLPVSFAAYHLTSPRHSRIERIGIVLVIGLMLYVVKVLQNPFTFMYPDEFVHAYNAQQVLDTKSLFGENPLLKVTPSYPGLPSAASAVASLTGLHVFGAGLVVIGAARVLLMLALFFLFEEVSGSARIAGMAALIYAAHPNFLFWVSQYAYESLALPIAIAVVICVARWMRADDGGAPRAWAVAALFLTIAVVLTHHMTSYALLGFLVAASLVCALYVREARNPRQFALFAGVTTLAWLVVVASETVGYLKPVFWNALRSTLATISKEGGARRLFVSDAGQQTPLADRIVALASVALIALAIVFALREVRRRYRTSPLMLVFAVAATAYLGAILLRFVPGAWEIANRASEFLFLGVASMLAVVAGVLLNRFSAIWSRLVVVAGAVVVFAGGVAAGWPYDIRLGLPYRISVDGRALEPQGAIVARWARSNLGAGRRFVADDSNARLLLWQDQLAAADNFPASREVIRNPTLDPWMVDLLEQSRIDYLLMDRRIARNDKAVGYFFTSQRAKRLGLYPRSWYEKLDRQPGVSRIFDSGDIVVYSIKRLRYEPELP
jgi:hypothetical protein